MKSHNPCAFSPSQICTRTLPKIAVGCSRFRQRLIRETCWLWPATSPIVAGTLALDRQVRALNAVTHVFGHSHIDFDQVIEGVRYVHHAFDYPREDGWSKEPLKQIWKSAAQAEVDLQRRDMSIIRNPAGMS